MRLPPALLVIPTILAFLAGYGGCHSHQSPIYNEETSGAIIGLDIGGTLTKIVSFSHKNADAEILKDPNSSSIFQPSSITFTSSPKNPILYGAESLSYSQNHPNSRNTISHLIYLIGRNSSDPIFEELNSLTHFNLVFEKGQPLIAFDGVKLKTSYFKKLPWVKNLGTFWKIWNCTGDEVDRLHVDQIFALMIGQSLYRAEKILNRQITNAFVNVPYSYWPQQEESLHQIFEVIKVKIFRFTYTEFGISQGLALDKAVDCTQKQKHILQIDWGGSSLHFVLLSQRVGEFIEIENAVRVWFGSVEISRSLVEVVEKKLLSGDKFQKSHIWNEVERVKKQFEDPSASAVVLQLRNPEPAQALTLTLNEFNLIVGSFINTAIEQLSSFLDSSPSYIVKEITDVILAGGGSNLLPFQTAVISHLSSRFVYPEYHISTVAQPIEAASYNHRAILNAQYGPCGCGTKNPMLVECLSVSMSHRAAMTGAHETGIAAAFNSGERIESRDMIMFADYIKHVGTQAVITQMSPIYVTIYEAMDPKRSKLVFKDSFSFWHPMDQHFLVKVLASQNSTIISISSISNPERRISRTFYKREDFRQLMKSFHDAGMIFEKKNLRNQWHKIGGWTLEGSLNFNALPILRSDVTIILANYVVNRKWW